MPLNKLEEAANGAVLASDAFFPFGDTVETAAKHGIAAIIQPGGSIRDEESIKAADEAGIAMVFTGIRHFKHLEVTMKVCVIGNGGREHAIAWRLSISPSVEKVYAVPGSAAMKNCAELVGIDWSHTDHLIRF